MSTPPAAIIVEDLMGRRTGMDVSKGVPLDGNTTNYLTEIPHSTAESQLLDNDEGGPSEDSASWFVNIMDGGDQVYLVNLIGVAEGVADLGTDAGRPQQGMIKTFYTPVFVRLGVTRQVRVAFMPSRGFAITVERIVSATALSDSIRIACDLKMIKNAGVCKSLSAKVDAANADIARGQFTAARGSLRAMISEISAQSGKQIIEPAVTILREEVEALAKSLKSSTKVSQKKTQPAK